MYVYIYIYKVTERLIMIIIIKRRGIIKRGYRSPEPNATTAAAAAAGSEIGFA